MLCNSCGIEIGEKVGFCDGCAEIQREKALEDEAKASESVGDEEVSTDGSDSVVDSPPESAVELLQSRVSGVLNNPKIAEELSHPFTKILILLIAFIMLILFVLLILSSGKDEAKDPVAQQQRYERIFQT